MSETQKKSRPASEEAVISFRRVTKRFGDTVALQDVSFEILPGDIFGFIGPNGAGKTTTLKLIATLLSPDSGGIRVAGYATTGQPRAVRRSVGYMPDILGVYRGLTVEEYLDFFGAAYVIPPARRGGLIGDLLELTDLTQKRTTLVTGLSRGMQQRLGLARALIHDPAILLLDEPASGLDPRARVEIRELLKELAGMGKTILVSSHILSDLEDLSNRIGIIEQGKLLYCGPLDDALRQIQGSVVVDVEVAERAEEAAVCLREHTAVEEVRTDGVRLEVKLTANLSDVGFVATRLVERGFVLTALTKREPGLEDAFLSITQGAVQ
jgi:ABC-2 type transport system ATP-binding protein